MKTDKFSVQWFDSGLEPSCDPDPRYPNGKAVTVPSIHVAKCTVRLPYPADRIGIYIVRCRKCGSQIGVTTAGRYDDPVSVEILCAKPLN